MILGFELCPLDSLQVLLAKLDIAWQLGLDARIVLTVFRLDYLSVDLPFNVDHLGRIECQDRVWLCLHDLSDLVWSPLNIEIIFQLEVTENLEFPELCDL